MWEASGIPYRELIGVSSSLQWPNTVSGNEPNIPSNCLRAPAELSNPERHTVLTKSP